MIEIRLRLRCLNYTTVFGVSRPIYILHSFLFLLDSENKEAHL